jgi:hypothetical protein
VLERPASLELHLGRDLVDAGPAQPKLGADGRDRFPRFKASGDGEVAFRESLSGRPDQRYSLFLQLLVMAASISRS